MVFLSAAGITVLIMSILVIVFGVFEIINVRKTLTTMENIMLDLNKQYAENKEDITEFHNDVGDVKEIWEKKENWLCYLFNHRDLSIITDSINRLSAYTQNNDYDNAICEISLLLEYTTKSYHIMGFNIRNIL